MEEDLSGWELGVNSNATEYTQLAPLLNGQQQSNNSNGGIAPDPAAQSEPKKRKRGVNKAPIRGTRVTSGDGQAKYALSDEQREEYNKAKRIKRKDGQIGKLKAKLALLSEENKSLKSKVALLTRQLRAAAKRDYTTNTTNVARRATNHSAEASRSDISDFVYVGDAVSSSNALPGIHNNSYGGSHSAAALTTAFGEHSNSLVPSMGPNTGVHIGASMGPNNEFHIGASVLDGIAVHSINDINGVNSINGINGINDINGYGTGVGNGLVGAEVGIDLVDSIPAAGLIGFDLVGMGMGMPMPGMHIHNTTVEQSAQQTQTVEAAAALTNLSS